MVLCKQLRESCWHLEGVYATNCLFLEHMRMIISAERFLYLEDQWPFHNCRLTHLLCQTVRQLPQVRVLMMTPVQLICQEGLWATGWTGLKVTVC